MEKVQTATHGLICVEKKMAIIWHRVTVDDEGNYVFYLEPGEYTMKVYRSNVIMDEDEEVSVTNDAVVKWIWILRTQTDLSLTGRIGYAIVFYKTRE